MSDCILEHYVKTMASLGDIVREDLGVAIADKKAFIAYYPAKSFDLNTKPGDLLKRGEALYRTIHEGKSVNEVVPAELYGVPFMAMTYPVRNAVGEIVGGIGISKNIEAQKKIEHASSDLFATLESTTDNVANMNADMQSLFTMISDVNGVSKQMDKALKESDQIMALIKKIASQTNMLGLNAAIEASRAGTHGRGFTVVAEEMRRLAMMSGESSDKVSKTLTDMNHLVLAIMNAMLKIESVAKEQMNVSEEMTGALEEITATSQLLAELTQL